MIRINVSSFYAHGIDSKTFNTDEIGLFHKDLLLCSMIVEGDEAEEGKKSKDRISTFLTGFTARE